MKQDSCKILVVDDEKISASILEYLLTPYYTVFTADSGQKAIEIATEVVPDLILLDVILPDISGFDVFVKIKSIDAMQNIPVIFITGLNKIEEEERGLFLGAVDYITKPFANSLVLARVNTHIQTLRHIRTIEQLCAMDSLTTLPNRRGLDKRLLLEWSRAIREKKPISLLFIDIDKFKHYNDTYGHQFGDLLIQTAADIYKEALKRATDFVARWGGDEFVVLMPDTDLIGACHVAERIRKYAMNTLVPYADESNISITVSIGVNSILPTANDTTDIFLKETDNALYEAKEAGRNRFRVHNKLNQALPYSELDGSSHWLEDTKHKITIPTGKAQTVSNPRKQELSSFMTLAKCIPYLEADRAVALIGGSTALYKKIFSIVVVELPLSIKQIEDCLHRDNDLDSFVIKMHSMIGSLSQIGCMELAEQAMKLEKAAKSGNSQYCCEYYSTFKKKLLHFYDQANAVLQNAKKDAASTDVHNNDANMAENLKAPSKKNILVIDDNSISLALTKAILSNDYKVHAVISGAQALAFIEKRRPDLILLDMEMPNISGTELFNMIKLNPKLSGIPVIFLTSHNSTEIEADVFKLGAADYIRKPINDVVLLTRVRMHLEP